MICQGLEGTNHTERAPLGIISHNIYEGILCMFHHAQTHLARTDPQTPEGENDNYTQVM